MKYLDTWAELSECGLYRYSLGRQLSDGQRRVLFVGLNPSTADAHQDDPTIRRCVGFARDWGFSFLYMGNVYAYRATNPKVLPTIGDPVGPHNLKALKWMIEACELVVAAWGANPLTGRAHVIADYILSLEKTRCLGVNADKTPRHPLYLAANTPLSEHAFGFARAYPTRTPHSGIRGFGSSSRHASR